MKKTILCLTIAAMLLSLNSCREVIVQENTNFRIVDLDVPASAWAEYTSNDGLNRYYMAEFDIPELTEKVCRDGIVCCYYVDDNGKETVQCVLPYTRHYQDVNDNGELIFWTTTTDYEFYTGHLNIYFTSNDFAPVPPDGMKFRLTLIW